ncbi:MAG: glycosyltransferase, partial [Gemmatimonadetes bacterium]|nr:glycosyltransferase [Gemmatimonadota bacterium]
SRLAAAPRVRWLGFREDVPAIMRALDLLVVPSHYEGFGLVVAEAMAAGTAVIATRTSNFPELITDGIEGRLVPPRDPPALAETILELLHDPELRARMGRAGRERVRREFTLERMLDRHEELLAEVVAEAR